MEVWRKEGFSPSHINLAFGFRKQTLNALIFMGYVISALKALVKDSKEEINYKIYGKKVSF